MKIKFALAIGLVGFSLSSQSVSAEELRIKNIESSVDQRFLDLAVEELQILMGNTKKTCVCNCIGKNSEGKDKTLCENKGAHNEDTNLCEQNIDAGPADAGKKCGDTKDGKECEGYARADHDKGSKEKGVWSGCHEAYLPISTPQ